MSKPIMHAPGDESAPEASMFRMPAEWEHHQATWLSWPHNRETWPDELEEVERIMALAVRALATGETVIINVLDDAHQRNVASLLDDAGVRGEIHFAHIPTDDAWIRDHGAIFIQDLDGGIRATSWQFNAWGEKYPPWDLDNAAAERMAMYLEVPVVGDDMVLEGGSIEVNGSGVLLTTASCLLNPNRNRGMSRIDIEKRLRDKLGIRDVVWLGNGIAGDDTDGHIDDITRFVSEHTILTTVEKDREDENFDSLQENLEVLHGLRRKNGDPYTIIELPMPAPLHRKGERMPASYANFYIGNRVVLMPAFDDPADAEARAILSRCFPTRTIVTLDCRALIWGLGAFHCLTQQVPAQRVTMK